MSHCKERKSKRTTTQANPLTKPRMAARKMSLIKALGSTRRLIAPLRMPASEVFACEGVEAGWLALRTRQKAAPPCLWPAGAVRARQSIRAEFLVCRDRREREHPRRLRSRL